MQKKKCSAKHSAICFFENEKMLSQTLSYFFLLLSVGLRGEVDPRESLPLKSPFLTAPVFRYIVRLAFASVKHNVLVRVHLVKRGFTRSPRDQFWCRRPLSLGGAPPLILHCFFILFFASFWEGFSNHSGHSLGHHFQQ